MPRAPIALPRAPRPACTLAISVALAFSLLSNPSLAGSPNAQPVPLALGGSGGPHGAPVAPMVVTLEQPDGTTILTRPWGDEHLSGYETVDGFTLIQTDNGEWQYADVKAGELVATGLRPDRANAPTGIGAHLRPQAEAQKGDSSGSPPGGTFNGTQPALVILVQFLDQASVGTTPASWSSKFFGTSNSVADYYDEASYGTMEIVPATESHGTVNDGVVGWLTLNSNHPDTRKDTSVVNQNLSSDAILAANPYVNFASYDTDDSGTVESRELHVTVIVAGYETSYGGAAAACAPGVWGHQWEIQSPPTVDGVVVGGSTAGDVSGYTQFGEWHCSQNDSPGHSATIGIMVHEIGHDIGWPDLYDTVKTNGDSYGVGLWSVMGNGSWNYVGTNDLGSSPALPDAFSRSYQGWLTPTVVTGTTQASITAASTAQSVYELLPNPNGVDWSYYGHSGVGEYFLVENRQQNGYDAGLPGCGLLVWHIDETRTSTNEANGDETRKLVDLEEADGLNQLDSMTSPGDSGDPFPGSTNNTSLTDSTNPGSRLYGGATSGVSITGIGGCAATMTATLTASGGTICPPDDGFEPNDSRGGAAALTNGESIDGIACDNDYFAIDAFAGQTLTVDLSFSHAAGDLDMRLYSESGTQLAVAQSTTDNEQIVHAVTQNGTYYIRVYGYEGATNTYTLTTTAPICPPDDGFEPNDSRGGAAALTNGESIDGIACDNDYFAIDAFAGQTLTVDLSFSHAAGDLDMRLYSESGTQLAVAQSTTDNEQIVHAVTQNGTYYIRVYGYEGATNGYALVAAAEPVDTAAPTVTTPAYEFKRGTRLQQSKVPVRIRWSGTDGTGGSGVARYRLQLKTGAGSWTNIGLSNPLQKSQVLQLAPGTSYRVRVKAIDVAGNASAWKTSRAFTLNTRQESSSLLSYSNGWQRRSGSSFFGGYVKAATAAGAKVQFTFTGRKVAWVSTQAPTRGIANVYVDGVRVARIDLYRASQRSRMVVWSESWSGRATHTVMIRVRGTAGRPRVDMDAILWMT